jgi:ubiquinone biosynthesis protein UbiJ
MLQRSIVSILNHLLLQETWSRTKLMPFAGQTVRFESGALSASLAIGSHGLFKTASNNQDAASVTLSLPADWLQQALVNRSSPFTLARISGSLDLAEALGSVFRNLSWDAEGDLSMLVGDIASHRLVDVGKRLVAWHQESLWRLAINFTEFWVEEHPTIAQPMDVRTFCSTVNVVREECASLEIRLQRLERQ